VHAGLDGEAVDLRTPLRIAIRPAALRVRIRAPESAGPPRERRRAQDALGEEPAR
jgi:hypothetical protein